MEYALKRVRENRGPSTTASSCGKGKMRGSKSLMKVFRLRWLSRSNLMNRFVRFLPLSAIGERIRGLRLPTPIDFIPKWCTQAEYTKEGNLKESYKFQDLTTRVYLLMLVDWTIFTNTDKNTIHLTYLQYFNDLEIVDNFVWGAIGLTHLYKSLTTTTISRVNVVLASSPVMAYPPPFPTTTPPSGYPAMQVSASPHDSTHIATKTRGEGFWKGWYI
ncbi:hypothetical protein TSUD_368120 [Trifolium subterraneum]|uniref:Aminotransferase-like plant mobile domain-containing protein n=1 Tax=Trifolium subterraneum TaxID=3900 RepID=A0A2Z6LI67_TRISU|nr:hypothetical protein TSUD_368120 [Trifolium subterraneum]